MRERNGEKGAGMRERNGEKGAGMRERDGRRDSRGGGGGMKM